MKQLLESGVHFGHRSRKWNPKMRDFIFTERNGVHIIDLQKTLSNLHEIHDRIQTEVQRGGTVLFVGTKRQAQEAIEMESARCGMPYVNQRWLGGTLTNWKTIKQRIDTLKKLEFDQDAGLFDRLTKKERLLKQREIDRLQIRLGGIRDMVKPPSMLFVIDVIREHTSVDEANSLHIPIIALVDTNGNPDQIDHIIPANDDAIRSIRLLTAAIADAVIEGQNMRKDSMGALPDFTADVVKDIYEGTEGGDDAYLGASTIKKLRDGELNFDDEVLEDERIPSRRRK
jgi:small subunit ribosomal protein S2